MPVNLAARPLGRVACRELSSCSPSLRVRRRTKGLRAPALELSVPALMVGAKGRAPGLLAQADPLGPELTLKLADWSASGTPGVPQGTRLAVVSIFAAGGRGHQRRPRAFLEVDRDVFGGQLRVVEEGRGQLAGLLVGDGDAGELDVDPVARVFELDQEAELAVLVTTADRQVTGVGFEEVDVAGDRLGAVDLVGDGVVGGEQRRGGYGAADLG